MVDGSSGMHLAQNLFSTTPERLIGEPHRYIPRPHPSDAELRRDELLRLALLPWRAGGALLGFVRDSADVAGEIGERLRALGHLARYKFVPTSDTPLNGPVGPHRVLDWLTLPLADLKAIRKSFGCSINDVVLGIVTGAVRDFLLQRQVHPDDLEFRVASPVNVRRPEQAGRAGNRVSTWIVPLPIREADPRKQIEAIHEITRAMKDSHQAAAIEIVEAIHEWLPIDIQSLSTGTQNMYVTNVPGPQLPLYLLGAKLKEIFLHPPLIQNLGLTVAVLSYDGRVCWGFTADYDRVPDIGDFAALVRRSFERLAERAGVGFESQHPIEVRSSAP
jgi:WS/DGAT/MGAT family acyltransferase